MEAKLDALETRVVTALIITHSWAARLAGAAYDGGSFGAGGVGGGDFQRAKRTHSGVIECLIGGGGGLGSGYQTSAVSVWKRAKMQEGQKTSSQRGTLAPGGQKAASVHPHTLFMVSWSYEIS